MKRRALLLGALLMPTAAHARTTKQKPKPKPAAPKPSPPKPPPPPAGPQPLKEAKTQLVAFNASAFPYRGIVPDSRKPFLDAQDGKRRGHTTLKGDVCWEDTTYSDRRSLLYLPPGYNPQLPGLIVLYLHGQGATLERDVQARQAIPRQIADSDQNVALVAPQLAYDAPDFERRQFLEARSLRGLYRRGRRAADAALRRQAHRCAFQRLGRGHRLLQRRLCVDRLCAGDMAARRIASRA